MQGDSFVGERCQPNENLDQQFMSSKKTKDDAKASANPRRRANAAQKRALKSARLAVFLREVGRQAQKGVEPNDRRDTYDLARRVKRMSPEEFDRLAREDEDT